MIYLFLFVVLYQCCLGYGKFANDANKFTHYLVFLFFSSDSPGGCWTAHCTMELRSMLFFVQQVRPLSM